MTRIRILALCGGVGGAKLAEGLARALPTGELAVVVNTGDDFHHLGLPISPDIDTVVYSLAGLADPVRGWGRAGESWHFMEALNGLGGPQWFNLGDRDLAMHVWRGHRLREGATLGQVTTSIVATLGITASVWPMSDDRVATIVTTDLGELPFQDYFVAHRCEPAVQRLTFAGAKEARPSPNLRAAILSGSIEAIIVCPSNPWLSIDPILAVTGMIPLLRSCGAPLIAVSPIVQGDAVKGPTAKIMRELGLPVSHEAVAEHYRGVIDAMVIDADGEADIGIGVPTLRTRTLMRDDADRLRLARETIEFAAQLGSELRD